MDDGEEEKRFIDNCDRCIASAFYWHIFPAGKTRGC